MQGFCSRGGGGCLSPSLDVFTNLEALRTPYYWDFLQKLHHMAINSISSPSPLPGEWGLGLENSKLLIITWSFWGPAPTQEQFRSPPHWNKRHSSHPGSSEGFRNSSRRWRPNIRTKEKCSQCSYHLGIYKGFRSPVPETRRRDQYMYFLLFCGQSQFVLLYNFQKHSAIISIAGFFVLGIVSSSITYAFLKITVLCKTMQQNHKAYEGENGVGDVILKTSSMP